MSEKKEDMAKAAAALLILPLVAAAFWAGSLTKQRERDAYVAGLRDATDCFVNGSPREREK